MFILGCICESQAIHSLIRSPYFFSVWPSHIKYKTIDLNTYHLFFTISLSLSRYLSLSMLSPTRSLYPSISLSLLLSFTLNALSYSLSLSLHLFLPLFPSPVLSLCQRLQCSYRQFVDLTESSLHSDYLLKLRRLGREPGYTDVAVQTDDVINTQHFT